MGFVSGSEESSGRFEKSRHAANRDIKTRMENPGEIEQ
jgi:hypothetical protein